MDDWFAWAITIPKLPVIPVLAFFAARAAVIITL
jgi:hypothetical protein